jgi:hypothetical protein
LNTKKLVQSSVLGKEVEFETKRLILLYRAKQSKQIEIKLEKLFKINKK